MFRYQAVERIPKPMKDGIVYYSRKYELAGLLCACGCGHSITLLVPDSHQVTDTGGYATVSPSIGVLDGSCKSHFIIESGNVTWLPAFSEASAARVMRTQIERHVARDRKPSWWDRIKSTIGDALRSFFGK